MELGSKVWAFDFRDFYGKLSISPTLASLAAHDPGRLYYDSGQIKHFTSGFTLASLRAEPIKAAVDKAINARANAFYAKHANATEIIDKTKDYYSAERSNSKPVRLAMLSALSEQQMMSLKTAYAADKRRQENQVLQSTITNITGSNTIPMTRTDISGWTDTQEDQRIAETIWTQPIVTTTTYPKSTDPIQTEKSRQEQSVETFDYVYRVPGIENEAQNHRAQISLIDEQFAQFMYGQNIQYLENIFKNELQMIDSDVYRLQVAYLNTILMSPIAGVVTGIYKNPGDAVEAGEPVIRVEDNSDVLMTAHLIYRGLISIGSDAVVETLSLFDVPGGPTAPRRGKVVAVRGLGQDDHWEAIIKCSNLADSPGAPIFPIGYHFDPEQAAVFIS